MFLSLFISLSILSPLNNPPAVEVVFSDDEGMVVIGDEASACTTDAECEEMFGGEY